MKYRGFSLLECCVVMSLVALSLSLAIPSISNVIQHSRIDNCAQAVFHFISHAKSLAITRNTNVILTAEKGVTHSDWTLVARTENSSLQLMSFAGNAYPGTQIHLGYLNDQLLIHGHSGKYSNGHILISSKDHSLKLISAFGASRLRVCRVHQASSGYPLC